MKSETKEALLVLLLTFYLSPFTSHVLRVLVQLRPGSQCQLSTKTVICGVDVRSIEDTAVIELLLTRPERKVE